MPFPGCRPHVYIFEFIFSFRFGSLRNWSQTRRGLRVGVTYTTSSLWRSCSRNRTYVLLAFFYRPPLILHLINRWWKKEISPFTKTVSTTFSFCRPSHDFPWKLIPSSPACPQADNALPSSPRIKAPSECLSITRLSAISRPPHSTSDQWWIIPFADILKRGRGPCPGITDQGTED